MKKIIKISSVLFLCATLMVATPVIAQTGDADNTTTTRTDDDHDDDGQDWGWIGLAGLLGLLGLRKKDDRHVHVDRRTDTPNTNR